MKNAKPPESAEKHKDLNLDPASLHFIPLGGSEEFGVNFNLYAYAGKYLAIDCGLGFADHRFPGVDILLPDASFIADQRKLLAGLVITHAHEDHIGAVAYLWPGLRCPIYCTAFTATVLKKKLSENPECRDARITVVDHGDAVDIGPFKIHFIHVAHSIPDTAALMIETKAGRVLHSGDWNLDPKPVLNRPTDEKSFRKFGDLGIMAYVGDSTNAEVPGRAGSETEVEAGLTSLFAECKGRIAVTIFASNISRIRSICRAARANKRHVAIIGRSLHTMAGSAFDCGMLEDIPAFVDEEEIESIPDNRIVLIVTGSQGEARAALARIARGENRDISFGRGDTVIFSARPIPGNETEIMEVRNNLVAGGATVITPHDTQHKIHVSGHPCRDEIAEMYQWVRPKTVIPVHGQRTQLEAQAAFARLCQIENVIVPNNGSVIRLGPGAPAVIDHVTTGLLAVEPNRIISADHLAIAERRKLQFTGVIHATVVLDEKGRLSGDPHISTMGLVDPEKPDEMRMVRSLRDEIVDILADMQKNDLRDDHAVQEEIRIGLRRLAVMLWGIKPKATVHVVRI